MKHPYGYTLVRKVTTLMKAAAKRIVRTCREFTEAVAQYVSIVDGGANRNPLTVIQSEDDSEVEALPSYIPENSPQAFADVEVVAMLFPKTVAIAQAETLATTLGFDLSGTQTEMIGGQVCIYQQEYLETFSPLIQNEDEVMAGDYRKMGLPVKFKQEEQQVVINFIVKSEPKSVKQGERKVAILKQFDTEWRGLWDTCSMWGGSVIDEVKEWAAQSANADLLKGLIIATTEPKKDWGLDSSLEHWATSPIGFEELLTTALSAMALTLRMGTEEQAHAAVTTLFQYRQRLIEAHQEAIGQGGTMEELAQTSESEMGEDKEYSEVEQGNYEDKDMTVKQGENTANKEAEGVEQIAQAQENALADTLKSLSEAVTGLAQAQQEMKALIESKLSQESAVTEEASKQDTSGEEAAVQQAEATEAGVTIEETARTAVTEAPPKATSNVAQGESKPWTAEERRRYLQMITR